MNVFATNEILTKFIQKIAKICLCLFITSIKIILHYKRSHSPNDQIKS